MINAVDAIAGHYIRTQLEQVIEKTVQLRYGRKEGLTSAKNSCAVLHFFFLTAVNTFFVVTFNNRSNTLIPSQC